MSAEEKMQAMELLWEDFCSRQPDFRSPDWHEAILNEREKRLKEGKDRLIEKNEIRIYAVIDCRREPAWIRERLQ